MKPNFRWTLLVAVQASVILLVLPLGYVFTSSLVIHRLQLLVLGLVGGLGWLLALRWPNRLPTPLTLAPLPLLGAMAIAALASPYPTLSWAAVWNVGAYGGVFLLLAFEASDPDGRKALIGSIGIVAVLAFGSYAFSVASAWRTWLDLGLPITSLPLRPENAGGLALLPTWFADLLCLAVPLLVGAMWQRGSRRLATAIAIVALGALIVTGTRSVLVLLVGGFVIVLLLAIGQRRGGRPIVIAAVGSSAIALAGVAVLLASARSFDEGRFSAYTSGVQRFLDAPLLGSGPGTYGVRRMADAVDALGHLAFPDAHNIVLTTLAETGLVGLAGVIASVVCVAFAVSKAWRAGYDRSIVGGTAFGVIVFIGHGMVDVVFGLIAIVVMALSAAALAATTAVPKPDAGRQSGPARWALIAAAIVIVVSTALVWRTESSYTALDQADRDLPSTPGVAYEAALRATTQAPDSVPGWWVQMVAADAAGRADDAIAAAQRTVELEGFGQEWMSLAILASRAGDRSTELDAIQRATAGPTDPFVELNAAILLDQADDSAGAQAAAYRLIEAQPDIEPTLVNGPASLSAIVARIRGDVARERLSAGDEESAFLLALYGEDRALADELLGAVVSTNAVDGGTWTSIVNGWFGDRSAIATLDTRSTTSPTLSHLLWSWRLNAHACDLGATEHWEKAAWIGYGSTAAAPNDLGVAPAFQSWMLPTSYPPYIWRLDHPHRPYVEGTWTYGLGRPPCVEEPEQG